VVDGIRALEYEPVLFVARLPDGTYVDVDTPHAYEAVRRVGRKLVKAQIIGTLTEQDCGRIGLRL
jgi:hypothetical protein